MSRSTRRSAALYEQIVTANGAIPAGSPLYTDASFAGIKARVEAFLAAADPLAHDDNPAITSIVMQALARLQQIAGRARTSSGSVRTTCRRSASSTCRTPRATSPSRRRRSSSATSSSRARPRTRSSGASSSTSRPRSPARSVVLEQRGVAEAQRGRATSPQASLNYAAVQLENAEARRATSRTPGGSCWSSRRRRPGRAHRPSIMTTR